MGFNIVYVYWIIGLMVGVYYYFLLSSSLIRVIRCKLPKIWMYLFIVSYIPVAGWVIGVPSIILFWTIYWTEGSYCFVPGLEENIKKRAEEAIPQKIKDQLSK